jgi:hypothetical protein
MALPYENLSKEAREEERGKRSGWLARLPKTTPEQEFMNGMAAAWAANMEAAEDLVEVLAAAAAGKGQDSPEVARLHKIRKVATTAGTWMKRAGVAAQEGAAGAMEIFSPHQLEEVMTEEETKAYKAYKKKTEEAKKQQAAGFPGGAGAKRRDRGYSPYPTQYSNWSWYQPYGQSGQWSVAGQAESGLGFSSSSPAAATATSGQLALGYSGQLGGTAAASGYMHGGASQRQRYPCKACGKTGHWMRDGLCKPDDVAAEMARKYALFASGRVPSSMNSTNLFMVLNDL